jgi:2-keto-4-pentenoate hydratase/2-oxohepta-3-ene-1,7-dioic acid hydratase in catechol pathway
MRLCRFQIDDLTLVGFYADDRVIPIDQAAEAYSEDLGIEMLLPTTGDLLDLLPPDGSAFPFVCDLSRWVDELDLIECNELSIGADDVRLLVPIGNPRKLFFLAGNYAAHIAEGNGSAVSRDETIPYFFMKPPSTTLTHPGDPVILPRISPDHVDWECELGVVIGRRCRGVSESEALEYVAGYTIVNDVSDRGFQPNPERVPRERDRFFDWLHGKWHDSFCPMGPCILTADSVENPQEFSLRLVVNGEVKQNGSTAQMIFSVAAIVSFLSQFVTLEPGDIISTGTPSGVGSASSTYLKPGDVIQASISGIGTLESPVEAEEDPVGTGGV